MRQPRDRQEVFTALEPQGYTDEEVSPEQKQKQGHLMDLEPRQEAAR